MNHTISLQTYPSIVIHESGAMSSKVEQSETGSDTFGASEGDKRTLHNECCELTVRFPYLVPVLVKRCKLSLKGRRSNNQAGRGLEDDTGVRSPTWHRSQR
jgi:hypothetical protein